MKARYSTVTGVTYHGRRHGCGCRNCTVTAVASSDCKFCNILIIYGMITAANLKQRWQQTSVRHFHDYTKQTISTICIPSYAVLFYFKWLHAYAHNSWNCKQVEYSMNWPEFAWDSWMLWNSYCNCDDQSPPAWASSSSWHDIFFSQNSDVQQRRLPYLVFMNTITAVLMYPTDIQYSHQHGSCRLQAPAMLQEQIWHMLPP